MEETKTNSSTKLTWYSRARRRPLRGRSEPESGIFFISLDTRNTFSSTMQVKANSHRNKKLAQNIQKLQSFALLEENWNLNGAGPFSNDLITKVIEIVKSLYFQPQVFPTGRDSIQLEYEKENGDYLEFEISQEAISCLRIIGDDEKEFPIKDISKINELVRVFHA